MYSRKYIRSSTPVATVLPRGGREVAPPPDYTGIAFADQKDRQDFPETLIPERPVFTESASDEPSAEAIEKTIPSTEEALPSASAEDEREYAADADRTVDEADPFSVEETALPPPNDPEPQTTPSDQAQEAPPLLTAELLRSLTLEDLLLYWMLLTLLLSDQEDQIYLLLGLLLFSR